MMMHVAILRHFKQLARNDCGDFQVVSQQISVLSATGMMTRTMMMMMIS
jgi:hypothetical protein